VIRRQGRAASGACVALWLLGACAAAPAETQVDLAQMQPGEKWAVKTQSVPVWIFRRTPAEMATLAGRDATGSAGTPGLEGPFRSLKPEFFVVFGNCPGSEELLYTFPGEGFVCGSNGAKYDLAGRALSAGASALGIPRHRFEADGRLVVATR
jgi:Rieske Fe-S protein